MFQLFALQSNRLVLLFNFNDSFDKLALLLCKDRRFLFKFVRVGLYLSHRALKLFETLGVSRLNLNHIVLSFFY